MSEIIFRHDTGVILHEPHDWSTDPYGCGDCIMRTVVEDMKAAARRFMLVCYKLLRNRKRWPDECNELMKPGARSQKVMTRDPYGYYWSGVYQNGSRNLIKSTKPPFYLYRPYFWAYRSYLITGKDKYLRRYMNGKKRLIWWGKHTESIRVKCFNSKYRLIKLLHHRFGLNEYSLRLWDFMDDAID